MTEREIAAKVQELHPWLSCPTCCTMQCYDGGICHVGEKIEAELRVLYARISEFEHKEPIQEAAA